MYIDKKHAELICSWIAQKLQAIHNCQKSGNSLWLEIHKEDLESFLKNHAPSGSGIDCGTKIDLEASRPDRIVLIVDYHHMDSNGFYDGWETYKISVKPSLAFGFTITFSEGRDRNGIKEYLAEVYQDFLGNYVSWTFDKENRKTEYKEISSYSVKHVSTK